MHSLRISRSSRVLFEDLIGFMPESPKQKRLEELNYSEKLTTKKASPNHFTDLEKSAFTFRNAHQAMEKLIFTTKL